jgi:hypothetical protein
MYVHFWDSQRLQPTIARNVRVDSRYVSLVYSLLYLQHPIVMYILNYFFGDSIVVAVLDIANRCRSVNHTVAINNTVPLLCIAISILLV